MDEDYARLLRDWLRADPGAPQPRSEDDGHPLIPAPRPSSENRGRESRLRDPEGPATAEERSGLGQPGDPESRSEAEERSRWNHPSNWHRRNAVRGAGPAEIRDRLAEPEEPIWPPHDPDGRTEEPSRSSRVEEPSRWSRLDEQSRWPQLDDAVERSRRKELDLARERCRRDHPSNWRGPDDDPENRSR